MLPMDGFVVRCIFGRAGCEIRLAASSGSDMGTAAVYEISGAGVSCSPCPLCLPLPRGGRGGYGVRKRSFRPTLVVGALPCAPTPLSHPVGAYGVRKRSLRPTLVVGALPCAPTSLSHPVGAYGVRKRSFRPTLKGAARRAPTPLSHPVGAYGVRKRSFRPTLKGAARRAPTPLPPCGRGAGGEGYKKCAYSARSELKRCTLIRGRGGG